MMNQQSQAQSQAQTQAQLAHLREQTSILNQQLASQAQSHIQHLQQLVPFHQPTPHPHSTSTPPTPQPTPQASEPPTPVAPPSTQTGSSASFNPEEMMQQMKNTVESSIQRSMNQLPPPSHAPIPVPPQTSSHFHPPDDVPTSHQRSHRRSRSQRHRSGSRRPDKRPVSIPRSPRRHRSTRRTRRSSRSRSSSRRRLSTSRRASRRPSRATSITLRPASPRHREVRRRDQDDHTPQESTHTPATLQPATWEHHPQVSHYNTNTQSHYYHHDQYTTNKWQSRGQWKDYPKSSNTSNASGWIDYTKPPASHHTQYDSSTKPLTAFSSDSNTTYLQQNRPSHRSGSVQSRSSTTVPPGHVAINLQDGSKDEWVRNVRFALSHPERMRAPNEIPAAERPKPTTTMDHQDYEQACEQLHQVDQRIPPDGVKKLSNYFSVPTFCLATTYPPATSENFQSPTLLPSSCPYLTPVISRCRLPLANVKTTHGHSFMGRHFILLSRSSSKARSDQPTGHIIEIFNVANCQPLGHSTLAGKYPTVTRPSHHGRRESFSMLSKRKEKDSKTSSSGRCTEDQPTTPHTKLEAMSWLSSVWWKKELSPRLRSTRLPTATMWD